MARELTPAPVCDDIKAAEVKFRLEHPNAREVYLCGDFNRWSPASLRMTRVDRSGFWERRLLLEPGAYQYKFVVDGEWMTDPNSEKEVVNPFGSVNSIVEVDL
jgi:1,4-alpha-glucan branching enzyme